MNTRRLAILVLVTLLLLQAVTVSAQEPGNHQTRLLLLPVPPPDALRYGAATVEVYTRRAAQPLLERLAHLRRRGEIEDFELLPDHHAVRVTTTEAASLRGLDGADAILAADEAGITCAADGARATEDRLEAARILQAAPANASETNPSIGVYRTESTAQVYGYTDPNTGVRMVLRDRAGAVKAVERTQSSSSGLYVFYPLWETCRGFAWSLWPGETVEVTAAGRTVRTMVADVRAVPRPENNTVTGTTAPHRTVQATADQTATDCGGNSAETATATSGADGDFTITLDHGFDRSVKVTVRVFDANQNSTTTSWHSPRIVLDHDGDTSGYLQPNVAYTAALVRGGSTVATFGGTTGPWGSYDGSFPQAVEPGDVIQVSGGGQVVSTTFVGLTDLIFDTAGDRITGNLGAAAAGRTLKVSMRHDERACDRGGPCVVETVAGNGDFTMDLGARGFDLQRGDDGYPRVFDDEGNVQRIVGHLIVPVLTLKVRESGVEGYWREPGAALTMTLRDAGGAVKDTETVTAGSYDGRIWGHFWGTTMEPGDSVKVSDGTHALSVASVPDLTATLDAAADAVSGAGPDGSALTVRLDDFIVDPGYLRWTERLCRTSTPSGGTYSAAFGGALDVKARDRVDVYHTTREGHGTRVRSYAFAVDAEKGGSSVDGFTPAPDMEVYVELRRRGSVHASFTTRSSGEGEYGGSLENGAPAVISEGDIVWVEPEGMVPYELSIPELTVEQDPARNEIEGRAPPYGDLRVALTQTGNADAWGALTTADGHGDYAVGFDGVYLRGCTEADVGLCTQPRTTYYNDGGHSVSVRGPEPADVSADALEPDDVFTDATPYAGVQSHTFHAEADTDWIRFSVAPGDVGSPTYVQTTNLGPNANTGVWLYSVEGGELVELASDVVSETNRSKIVWTPGESGTYYARVEPLGEGTTVVCGATYDFLITRHRVYLPLLMRRSREMGW